MAVTIDDLAVRSKREVAEFLTREDTAARNVEPSDDPCGDAGLVAVSGHELVGIAFGAEVPSVNDGESYVFPHVVVAAARRRQGIGRQLLDALATLPRMAPTAWAVVTPAEGDDVTPTFLRAAGFEARDDATIYERASDLAWAPRLGDFTLVTYDGADEARNAVIADLHRRAYRGRFGIADLGVAGVKAWCGAMTCLVLEDAGRVAGCAFVNINETLCGVASILVARRYWGGGAADALMDAMVTFARGQGRATIMGGVHRANHASHAMVARHGWRARIRVPYLARRIGGA